LTSPRVV